MKGTAMCATIQVVSPGHICPRPPLVLEGLPPVQSPTKSTALYSSGEDSPGFSTDIISSISQHRAFNVVSRSSLRLLMACLLLPPAAVWLAGAPASAPSAALVAAAAAATAAGHVSLIALLCGCTGAAKVSRCAISSTSENCTMNCRQRCTKSSMFICLITSVASLLLPMRLAPAALPGQLLGLAPCPAAAWPVMLGLPGPGMQLPCGMPPTCQPAGTGAALAIAAAASAAAGAMCAQAAAPGTALVLQAVKPAPACCCASVLRGVAESVELKDGMPFSLATRICRWVASTATRRLSSRTAQQRVHVQAYAVQANHRIHTNWKAGTPQEQR